MFTFGVLLESLAGTPMAVSIISGLFVMVVYTMIGGMWAVALTDFIQMLVIVLGMFILLYYVLDDVGGWNVIAVQLPEHALRLIPLEHTLHSWLEYIHVWLALGVSGIAASSVIHRALSARSEAVAQNSFYIASFAYVALGVVPLTLGFVASVTMPGLENPNAVLTDLAILHLPPILVILFVGAIVSACLSGADSILLSASTIICTNLLPLVKKSRVKICD